MYRTIAVLSVVLLIGLAGCGGPGPGAETTAEEPAVGDDGVDDDDGVGDTPTEEDPLGTPTEEDQMGTPTDEEPGETPTDDEGDGMTDEDDEETATDEDETANIAP